MITSIATIAAAITGLIGIWYKISSAIKQAKEATKQDLDLSLEKQVLEAKTDEERANLAHALSDNRTK